MLIAYDLETTRIEQGTPRLLYVTAFGESMRLSVPITGGNRLQTFCNILETYFLIPEYNKAKFIAWNGNNYDAYFIAQALLKSDRWLLQPYMTASKALRGIKVKSKEKIKIDGMRKILQVQFLDGISMTGMVGKTLKSFLETFAPELPKLSIGNFENIDFDANNPEHRAYAERDSEGLYIGMSRVQKIIETLTEKKDENGTVIQAAQSLKPTIGNLAINYFMDNVPEGVELYTPGEELSSLLHGPLKRGGYCWCMGQYSGPVWKYDLNQAYAAAMRDAELPSGTVFKTNQYMNGQPGIYETTISRSKKSLIPFYFKTSTNQGIFTLGDVAVTCWITSIEIEHLRKDNWNVEIHQGFYWDSVFCFSDVVSDLELLRRTDSSGPSGPLGTMVKAIGNNAYGKTLEQLNDIELIVANECPAGYEIYDPFNEECSFVFSRQSRPIYKRHHLPQIGAFVTAHVRCKVRDTALLAPNHFLYADTDCVVFSKPVELDIDKYRYGAWKVEAENVFYIIIGKKLLCGDDGTMKAKGMRVKELTRENFENWLIEQPNQNQTQRQNFLKFLGGSVMFKQQKRRGTDVTKSAVYRVDKHGKYIPS